MTDGSREYHQWLAGEIADLFCKKVLPSIIGDYGPGAIDFLATRNEGMEKTEQLLFESLRERLAKEPFLPVLNNPKKRVSPSKAALSDNKTVSEMVTVIDSEVKWEGRHLVEPEWSDGERLATLEKLGGSELEKTDFIAILGSIVQPDPFWCSRALYVVLKWIEEHNWLWELKSALANQSLFLTNENKLRSLTVQDLPPLFRSPRGKTFKIPNFVKMDLLHPEIGTAFEKDERDEFESLLDQLSNDGLHKFSPLKIVEEAVLPAISHEHVETELNDKEKEELLHFLVDLKFNEKRFEDTEPFACFVDLRWSLAKSVFVPTRNRGWLPAWKVYAGVDWEAEEGLERLYKEINDRDFLASPESPVHDGISVGDWKRLYRFIGVSWEPKILPIERKPDYWGSYSMPNPHPSHIEDEEWDNYSDYLRSQRDLSDMWGWDIELRVSYVLDNWRIIKSKTLDVLELAYKTGLFDYLVGEKSDKADIRFTYTKKIHSYPAHCLSFQCWAPKNLSWIHADDGQRHPPNKIFLKNSEVAKALSGLVPVIDLPSPAEKVLYRRWEDLIDEIGIRTKWEQVQIEDWRQWLELIPNIFTELSKDNVEALKRFYRNCLERCSGSNDDPPFSNLKVLVHMDESSYAYQEARDALYVDDPKFDSAKSKLLEKGWRLFPLDLLDDRKQNAATNLFGMSPVSQGIHENVRYGNENSNKSKEWQEKFERMQPFLLARLAKDRPESRDQDKSLLQSIKVTAVDGLERDFTIIESDTLLQVETAIACWSGEDGTNHLFLDIRILDRDLWSAIADALAERINRAYYEAFEVLLLCPSDEDKIRKLRHARVSEEDIRHCEEILKDREPQTVFPKLPEEDEEGDIEEIGAEEEEIGEELEKDEELSPESEVDAGIDEEVELLTVEIGEYGRSKSPEGEEVTRGGAKISVQGGQRTTGSSTQTARFTTEEVEKAAMAWAEDFERRNGRDPRDVSTLDLGYDIESTDAETGEIRYIEVKGASGSPEKRVQTVNALRVAASKGDHYYLYYVLGLGTDEGEIRIVQNPAAKLIHEEKTFYVSIPRESADEIVPIKRAR